MRAVGSLHSDHIRCSEVPPWTIPPPLRAHRSHWWAGPWPMPPRGRLCSRASRAGSPRSRPTGSTTPPPTLNRIRAWWSLTPLANIAAPTGHPGFDVLDVDVRTDGSGGLFWQARTAGLLGDGSGRADPVRRAAPALPGDRAAQQQRARPAPRLPWPWRLRAAPTIAGPHRGLRRRSNEVIAARTDPGRPLDWAAVTALLIPTAAAVPAPRGPRPAVRPGPDPTPWLAAHVARQPEGNRDNALFWAACRAAEAGAPDLAPLVDAAVSAGLPEAQARRTIRSAQDTIARGSPTRSAVITTSADLTQPPIRSAL